MCFRHLKDYVVLLNRFYRFPESVFVERPLIQYSLHTSIGWTIHSLSRYTLYYYSIEYMVKYITSENNSQHHKVK